MSKQEFKKLLNDLNIKYEEYEYYKEHSDLEVKNAASYLALDNCENCSLYYTGIYIYFDNNDNFILIEGSEE